jgi:hypothetical protein
MHRPPPPGHVPELEQDVFRFEVTDDSTQRADPRAGSGILGLRDRADAASQDHCS